MIQEKVEVINKRFLTNSIVEMKLKTSSLKTIIPGQFINIKLDGFYLRRPISICNYEDNIITIIFKVVGSGTEYLANNTINELDILYPLGNGFNLEVAGDNPLCIGGGVGVPPLYFVCKELINKGKEVTVILGFNNKDEIFYEDEFKKLGAKVIVTTMDGSYGEKGYAHESIGEEEFSYIYSCGPLPMLKAIYKSTNIPTQLSLEERMGCGYGACMGCSIKTKNGSKRVCKDGPVFMKEELLWED